MSSMQEDRENWIWIICKVHQYPKNVNDENVLNFSRHVHFIDGLTKKKTHEQKYIY